MTALRNASGSREAAARIEAEWAHGPRRLRLASGSVHVWRADLSDVTDDVLDTLTADERERAMSFYRPLKGAMWARSRGVLRALLGRYLEAEPATIELRADGRGKPFLAQPARSRQLWFNVSHSGPLALYAFSGAGEVGVDVQRARARPRDITAIAARALGTQEARRLADLKPPERTHEFLRAWTRHEAARKCDGSGIWEHAKDEQPSTWIAELEVGASAAAAVAVQPRPCELRCFRWIG